MPTEEERDAEIAQHKESIRVLSSRLRELGAEGDGPSFDLAAKHREEAEAVTLFEKSTPAERLRLYQEDRPAWEKMLDDYEQAGLRRLFGSGR